MRVLLVNKFFYPRAGAETAFLNTRRLLAGQGHQVIDFAMTHPQNLPSSYSEFFAPERSYAPDQPRTRRAVDAASSIYSTSARRAVGRLVEEHPPDVAHLHNVYHQLTVSIIDELAERHVPMVMTLHDWKVACPAYTLFTNQAPCRRCPQGTVLNAIRYRCVKGSIGASAVAATEATLTKQRRTYQKIQRFIAPSRFAIDVAEMGGIPRGRVAHVPNFIPDEELTATAAAPSSARFLYAGRLDQTKGIRTLLAAFEQTQPPAELRVAGEGELAPEVRSAASRNPRITYLGMLDRVALTGEMDAARAVILPSLYEDNGPLIILEAQARAKAMIVTDRGGPKEFVRDGDTGLVADPAQPAALVEAMNRLTKDEDLARELGRRARRQVEREHSGAIHLRHLMRVYGEARAEVAEDG